MELSPRGAFRHARRKDRKDKAAYAKQAIGNALIEHRRYINERGEDHPAVLGWRWGGRKAKGTRRSSTEADNL